MTVSVFPPNLKVARSNKLENITLRGFGGGWNAIETDLQMESTYLVKVRNFRRTPGGTQKIRYGSKAFSDLTGIGTAGGHIVDMTYFAASLVCVISTGEIIRVQGDGTKSVIWSAAIAGALPGAPPGWTNPVDLVNFVAYKRELIIHNGRDKPVTISDIFVTTYLADLVSGSRVNVPIGKYGCVVSNYHCIANINPFTASPKPTTIYISSVGTSGTFPGDAAPNDSISIDVGAFAPQGAIEIRGIAGFRANLLVFFQDQTVIVKLGTYNAAGVHEPFFPDTMPTFGLLGHRCVAPVENDLLFAGLGGMASARRNLLSVSGTLETQSLSERIDPAFRKTVGALTDTQQLKECFMIYDALGHDMLFFTPSGQVFTYSFNTKLKYSAWSEFSGLNVQCGCRSFLGRVFYANGLKIFQHGNRVYAGEEYFKDRIGDPTAPNGMPIDFELELPWLDSKNPMSIKFLRFVAMATKGNAQFTLKAYVDNLYKNHDGDIVFPPALSMDFVANEAPGFGYDAGPYGGGRRSGDPRLWKFPVKFKTLKIAMAGAEAGDLELVNMSFLFSRGKFKR